MKARAVAILLFAALSLGAALRCDDPDPPAPPEDKCGFEGAPCDPPDGGTT